MDIQDRINELALTLNQAKAAQTLFTSVFCDATKKDNLMAVDVQHETYIYMASVLSDLICKAIEQIDEIDVKAQKAG